ncbi:hypothetical protein CVD28_06900 [Bacillus sp. M6-12]|nr:hypothetical protein CVD28_06900 [Bacillus sp. M6-12]
MKSAFVNKSIREHNIRKAYGVTVVAIIRNGNMISNPMPEELLRIDDTLLVFGSEKQLTGLKKLYN